jgi:hypothetical protein
MLRRVDTPKFIETTKSEYGYRHVPLTDRDFKTEDGSWQPKVIDHTPFDETTQDLLMLMDIQDSEKHNFDISSFMTQDWGKKVYILWALNEKDGRNYYAQTVDSFKEVIEFFRRDPYLGDDNQIEFKTW